MFRRALLLALVLTPALAARAAAEPPAEPTHCAFSRQGQPNYVVWVCTADGSALSDRASILHARTTTSGREVVLPVWSGPLSDVVTRADELIAAHRDASARCVHYFHLANRSDGSTTWNAASDAMRSWWLAEGAGRFTDLCYTSEPGNADFVLVWGARQTDLPNAFTLDLPAPGRDAATAEPSLHGTTLGALAVYSLHEGFDGDVVRLGTTLYSTESASASSPAPKCLLSALAFLESIQQ